MLPGRFSVAFSRPNSHDLEYAEEKYRYIEYSLTWAAFILLAEEAVWKKGVPIWGMNYYGKNAGGRNSGRFR